MIFRIHTGKHRARPLRFGLWWNRKSFAWSVKFTDSCRYDLKTDDQFDTNKLCGIGYIPGFHHKDSARFGWRYWPDKGWVELMAYCYVGGKRIIQNLEFCEIGKTYHLQLNITEDSYVFNVFDPAFDKAVGGTSIPITHKKKLGYRLGVFFGGNRPASQDIQIQLDKL